jgi:MFS family permease
MDAAPAPLFVEEMSLRYAGWRVVAVCFVMAAFAWALGFYGQAVYLAELQKLYGWPASTITAATTFFYLLSAALVVFVGDAIRALGPRLCLVIAVSCMAAAAALLSVVAAPWQLYGAYALMAFGWAGVTVAAISNTIGLWFDHRRGLALSLALNGASIGGVVGVPLLVYGIASLGFAATMQVAAASMVLVLVPLIALGIGPLPAAAASSTTVGKPELPAREVRRRALRSLRFWTITAPFAMVLLAQVGFIVHQISYIAPLVGRASASIAVSLMTVMAVAGRVGLGMLIDRVDQRAASAVLFASQAAAIAAMLAWPNEIVLLTASAIFGLTVGNAITLPSIIVHHEFTRAEFGIVVSLGMAFTSVISALGPVLAGSLHDLGGGYALPFGVCILLELGAAIGMLIRGRHIPDV